jgi:hypothetical protein
MLNGNIVHYKAPTIVPTAELQFARTSRWSKWVQVDPDTAANSVEDSEMDAAFELGGKTLLTHCRLSPITTTMSIDWTKALTRLIPQLANPVAQGQQQ